MWGYLALAGLDLGLWAINKYLIGSPTPPKPPPQTIQIANTQEGIPIPLVYGTGRVDAPALVWHGNAGHSSDADGDGTYLYGADMIFVLGVPMQNVPMMLGRIWWGDELIWPPVEVPDVVDIHGIHTGVRITASHGQTVDIDTAPAAVRSRLNARLQFWGGTADQNVVADSSTLVWQMMTKAGQNLALVPGMRNKCVVALSMSPLYLNTTFDGETTIILPFRTWGTQPSPSGFSFEVVAPNF